MSELAAWTRTYKFREIYVRGLKYKTVDGFYRLTPAQRRRLEKKFRHLSVATSITSSSKRA